jgi:hypothetical protein
MHFNLDQGIEVLTRTPAVLRTMLQGLSEPWIVNNYGEKTFSPFDVVGHLVHGERFDYIARIQRILNDGDQVPFEKFDRYAMYEESKGKSIDDLLTEFAALRAANIDHVRMLHLDQHLDRKGLHPVLGQVTMKNLLACWVAHDLNHIHQIAKCMAIQYCEEVGPWAKFLGVYAPTISS